MAVKHNKSSSSRNNNSNSNNKTTCRPTTRCWMYARHSCCKFGWYPIAVAPLLTSAAVLSLYSSVGCEYIQVQVGFTPSNQAWNESGSLSLGFWYLQKDDVIHDWILQQTFHEGCDWYSDLFEDNFIAKDRTWNVARIMALVSGIASTLSAFLVWMFCFSPLPANFFWPGLLLPVVMIAFIAEGSKFLLFDIGLCRSSVWLPSGVNSLPQPAISCSLGHSAIMCIVSGSLLLVGLLMVCLKVPVARELDPHFGVPQSASGSSGDVIVGGAFGGVGMVNSISGVGGSSSERSGGGSSNGMANPSNSGFVGLLGNVEEEDEDNSIYTQDVYTNPDLDADINQHLELDEETTNTSGQGGARNSSSGSGSGGFGTAPDPGEGVELGRVSASRLSKMAALEERAAVESSGSLIERLVHDLNCSYQ
jgi:hypothetical protein